MARSKRRPFECEVVSETVQIHLRKRRVRRLMIELAWLWLRWQPDSALSQWFNRRFANNGKRQRRIGIVALARKLLIALWRYTEHGVIPEGAVLKTQG